MCNYLPLRKDETFIWTNINPLHSRMICAKNCWNWPSVFRARGFLNITNTFWLVYSVPNGELTYHLVNFIFFSLEIFLTMLDLVYLYWIRIYIHIFKHCFCINYFLLFSMWEGEYLLKMLYTKFAQLALLQASSNAVDARIKYIQC